MTKRSILTMSADRPMMAPKALIDKSKTVFRIESGAEPAHQNNSYLNWS